MWNFFLFVPFVVQAVAILLDEFYFHHKRGLPKWERIGHPIDTLSLVFCLAYVLWIPFSMQALVPYIILGVISCLLVTKDEWVHQEHCEGTEQWLHALLFINHPLVLIGVGLMWSGLFSPVIPAFFVIQFCFASLFCLYQTLYWNFVWKEK
jgi:hypothetical protein